MERALDRRMLLAKGRLDNAGYYTIPLDKKIPLEDNEKFAIIVKIITPGTVHPVAIEYDAGDGIAQVDLTDGEGYLSHDGKVWEHVEETQSCNLCLKAYTKEIKAVYKRNRRQRTFDMGHRIIFATGNEGKMREIRLILADLGLPILSMKEAGAEPEIVENGSTFGENAEIKARAVWNLTGDIVLADDSGLEVDYIGGEPGIYSARYLGKIRPMRLRTGVS